MLKENPNLKIIRLCLDHDTPGIRAMKRITDELLELGYQDTNEERSAYKDWNEDCKAVHGQPAQAAVESGEKPSGDTGTCGGRKVYAERSDCTD
nr:toprim domain-containing protein [Clostridium sp. MCC353]